CGLAGVAAARVRVGTADVSGKGGAGALIMAGSRAALVSQDLPASNPADLATRLNGFLLDSLDPGKFVTAFLAVVDAATGHVVYVNAGHNPPVLLRAGGNHELLTDGGTILGILPTSRYERGETTLSPGDLMVLYTDAVTEVANLDPGMWGEERLVAALHSFAATPCDGLVRRIAHEVRAFEGAHGPTDDVTLIALRRTAASPD